MWLKPAVHLDTQDFSALVFVAMDGDLDDEIKVQLLMLLEVVEMELSEDDIHGVDVVLLELNLSIPTGLFGLFNSRTLNKSGTEEVLEVRGGELQGAGIDEVLDREVEVLDVAVALQDEVKVTSLWVEMNNFHFGLCHGMIKGDGKAVSYIWQCEDSRNKL